MPRQSYPSTKKLIEMFFESVKESNDIHIISSDIYIDLKYKNIELYIYIKCISHEGNPWPKECQRAQLPIKKAFEDIKNDDIPFVFLGYDQANDVYVCWDPFNVKPRLNTKSSVSFHSRLSLQENVVEGRIDKANLTNGDTIILFKRSDVLNFLDNIENYFPGISSDEEDNVDIQTQPTATKLNKLDDDIEVKNYIADSSITSILQLVQYCAKKYQIRYKEMSFTDWKNLITDYLDNKSKVQPVNKADVKTKILTKPKTDTHVVTISMNYESYRKFQQEERNINTQVAESVPLEEDNEESETFSYYKSLINKIRISKRNGRSAPHKYILVLSIIDLIASGKIESNNIQITDELIESFAGQWRKHIPNNSPFNNNLAYPYWHMKHEPFWHMSFTKGYTNSSLIPIYSIDTLRNYTCVKLDDKLYELLQDKNERAKIIALINTLISSIL